MNVTEAVDSPSAMFLTLTTPPCTTWLRLTNFTFWRLLFLVTQSPGILSSNIKSVGKLLNNNSQFLISSSHFFLVDCYFFLSLKDSHILSSFFYFSPSPYDSCASALPTVCSYAHLYWIKAPQTVVKKFDCVPKNNNCPLTPLPLTVFLDITTVFVHWTASLPQLCSMVWLHCANVHVHECIFALCPCTQLPCIC